MQTPAQATTRRSVETQVTSLRSFRVFWLNSFRRSCLIGALLMVAVPSWAALGGNVASVSSDQQAWQATDATSALPGTTLHSLTLPNGVIVRQYLDAGTDFVFAVTWEGPVLPDFQRLLANQFGAYQDALRAQRRGVNLKTNDLIIESSGMMRAFSGRALLPTRLPGALSASDIR